MDTSDWLPGLLGPVDFEVDGAAASVPRRATINLIGLTVADDPTNERTNITVAVEGAELPIDLTTDVTGALPGANMAAATTGVSGSMSAADKTKLDGIQKQGASIAISAYAIDWSLGSVFSKTLGAGAQAFTFSNATDGQVIVVRVTGAASTLTWPSVKWPGGVAPTQTASGIDVYTFVKEGSTIYGSAVQAMA